MDQLEFLDCALPCEHPRLNRFLLSDTVVHYKMAALAIVLSGRGYSGFSPHRKNPQRNVYGFPLFTSPVPLPGKECPAEMLACKRGGCVAQRQVCDGTDDCGDWTDEENCGA